MKVSDMLDINFSLLLILPRIGMDLKYISLRIYDACQICNIDSDTFILICNVYTFNDYIPSTESLENSNLGDIIKYLHNSHNSYVGNELANLAYYFNKLLNPCNERQKAIVLKFFTDYEAELKNHFKYEEEHVFPYVEALIKGKKSGNYSIEEFEEHHENVDLKLSDLKNIVMKYLPPECNSAMRVTVLLSIYHLQDDLRRHTYVENNILVPMVSRLERNGK